MTTNYILSTRDLNDNFLKSVKTIFGKKEVHISITDSIDETEYLLSSDVNKMQLLKSIKQMEKGQTVVFKGDEFSDTVRKMLKKK